MIERSSTNQTGIDEKDPPIGLVAGNGDLPMEFVQNVRASGRRCVVVANIGEADPEIEKIASHIEWVKVGELGRIIKTLIKHGVQEVAFLGGITRINLFGGVKLDLRGMGLIAKLRSLKDDVLLRGIAGELERDGLKVIEPQRFLSESVPSVGYLSSRKLGRDERSDVAIGWETAGALGAQDVGQTVVVGHGLVLALEAVEGTDRCIVRGGELGKGSAIVVKRCKPQQDLRLDLPTIGPKTIHGMISSGCRALVVEAGKSLIVKKAEVVELANRNKISLVAISSLNDIS